MPRRNITPRETRTFCALFCLIASIHEAVYTSRIRGAFVHHATANISPGAQYFRAHLPSHSFSLFLSLLLSFSLSSGMCQRTMVCDRGRPHIVMPYEACDISCRASRTLQRLAHIHLPEMSRNKSKSRAKCFYTPWSHESRWSYSGNFEVSSTIAVFRRRV